jgi:hypothetical protein
VRAAIARRRQAALLAALAGLISPLGTAPARAADPQSLPAARLQQGIAAPTIDGKVDDQAWARVQPFTTFTQQDPDEGAPASERTEARVLVDQNTLYLSFICFDSEPDKIIVSQARRDSPLTDTDAIILVLDTFNDTQNAFVFGTNPLGIEYDGQVAGEGQTTGGTGGAPAPGQQQTNQQRGGINAFNPNWDGDWRVRASVTERGWEAEMAIPFKTLRYLPGQDRTWGFNVWRNIRRKNEQSFLSPIPRGFDIYRVSMAAKLTGLNLPAQRELKFIPYVLGSANKDFGLTGNTLDRNGEVGIDAKWAVRPSLTADFTVNTDFAQVEVDDEQVNLTRFDLFFPEKRSFFLENASTFQFGAPQQIELFFSRRIGLSGLGSSGTPIPIIGGARLSGKVNHWNIGLLDMQTERAEEAGTNRLLAPSNNFGTIRLQREVGRSTFGGIFVSRASTGTSGTSNRAYGLDTAIQVSSNGKLFAFIARNDSPGTEKGSDYAGRLFYSYANDLWQVTGGYSQVGERFDPEVGFVPRRGYRRPEYRVFYNKQPKRWPWIRRISPHTSYTGYYGFDNRIQSSSAHFHPFEIQPRSGGRFGTFVDRAQDRPLTPFTVFNANGKRVVIPPGLYTWYQLANEYQSDPSAVVSGTARVRVGNFYDGDYKSLELTAVGRAGSRFTASAGWTRQIIDLPYGDFTSDLVPVKVSYAFTTLANLQALVQYNGQSTLFSTNIRLAMLNRSGTGLFVVYNDRRDTSTFDPREVLGRSFVIKYTRLLSF